MSFYDIVIWMFLGIFLLTALMALASLPNWIRVGEYYKKKLFQLLILEVVACILALATQAVRQQKAPDGDLHEILLSQDAYGWDWQYSAKNWKSRFRFEHAEGGAIQLIGTTAVAKHGLEDKPIITWKSSEPFTVPKEAKVIKFNVLRTWTQQAAEEYPELQGKTGKEEAVQITLRLGQALEGSATDGWGPQWGIMLTSGFPR
jgi:hypothetical protein